MIICIMLCYRIYLLDDLGKIFHGEDVQASDDAASIAAAWKLLETHNASDPDIAYGIEIWLGKALILNSWNRVGR
jgi:hypothetical protein